jgi:hypothetical protein
MIARFTGYLRPRYGAVCLLFRFYSSQSLLGRAARMSRRRRSGAHGVGSVSSKRTDRTGTIADMTTAALDAAQRAPPTPRPRVLPFNEAGLVKGYLASGPNFVLRRKGKKLPRL